MPRSSSIGIVLHDFSLGGTERIALRLAREWARQGSAVTLFCGEAQGPLAALAGEGVRIVEATPPLPRAAGNRTKLGTAVARQLASEPVDLLFVPGNYHWPVIPRIVAMTSVRPRVVAQISAALRKPQRGPLRQWGFDRRMAHLLAKADAVVAMEDETAGQARSILRGPEVVTIPTPALDTPMRAPVPMPDGPPTILAVGRLVPEKGFATLIAGFARMAHPTAKLVIAGSGPDEVRLRGLAERLGVAPRVELLGYVADSRPWLDAAHLFVLPSRFEGFPAVLVEAVSAGRPVVATDCTPATRLLSGVPGAGMVVPIDDDEAMARAMSTMLGRPAPDSRALAGLVADHAIAPVAERYRALFARLVR